MFTSGVRGGRSDGSAASYADLPSEFSSHSQGYALVDEAEGEAAADAWAAHDRLERILAASGTRGNQILRQRMWQKDKRFFPTLERVRKLWQPEAAPSSGLGVTAVGGEAGDWYGIESIAVDAEDPQRLGDRRMLTSAEDSSSPSTSIYSQMVASGPLVFLAGHIPIRTTEPRKPAVAGFDDIPAEGRFLATGRSHPDARDGPIAAQSWFVYNEIRRTLERHGMTMADIVHVRIYLADLRDLATFHRVHRHFFEGAAPAMCIVGFDEVGHKGSRIEIEPTALQPNTVLRSDVDWNFPAPHAGPAAVRAGPLLLLAGMLGIDQRGQIARSSADVAPDASGFVRSLETDASAPWVPAQIWWAWRRVSDTCAAAGIGLNAVAKTMVYLRSEADLKVFEAIRTHFFGGVRSAFDCVYVFGPGPVRSASVQIDAIALTE